MTITNPTVRHWVAMSAIAIGMLGASWITEKLQAQSGVTRSSLTGNVITTSQFPIGTAQPSITLVNASSRMTDAQLGNVANALYGAHGTTLATRLSGQSCWAGERCLIVDDALLGSATSPEAMGAKVGDAVVVEIMKSVLR